MDIGTNTELIVGNKQRILAASCPAGPAFEGGVISCGMPALDGAIEAVAIDDDGAFRIGVIGDAPPEGICGSGLVDALVEMAYDDPLNMDSLDQAARSWPASQRIIAVRNYDIFGDSVVNRSGMLLADYVRLIRSRWPGSGVALYHYPHLDSRQSLELRREVFLEEAHAQGRP